ncbi:energy transducer TonB, partial [Ideonella dechloratans]|uniref:energy transducer TonB n=1 Tax=Ideonella dechloratans TaxID=36863 RepID=UPI0035B2FEC8
AAAPAGPVALPASALRYVTMPRLVYPAAARRLGETGTALVRVVVDVNGLPREVTLHQSSGHARLDQAALDAMRAARFQPYRVDGQPVEAVAIAPLAFQLQ